MNSPIYIQLSGNFILAKMQKKLKMCEGKNKIKVKKSKH